MSWAPWGVKIDPQTVPGGVKIDPQTVPGGVKINPWRVAVGSWRPLSSSGGLLGVAAGVLEGSGSRLGGVLGRLGAILRLSWRLLGSSWEPIGNQKGAQRVPKRVRNGAAEGAHVQKGKTPKLVGVFANFASFEVRRPLIEAANQWKMGSKSINNAGKAARGLQEPSEALPQPSWSALGGLHRRK